MLVGLGRRLRSLALPGRPTGLAQAGSAGGTGSGSGPQVKSSEVSLVDGLEDPVDETPRAYVVAEASASCPHDSESGSSVSERSGDDGAIARGTILGTSTSATVPGDDPFGSNVHANAFAEITYEYNGSQWQAAVPTRIAETDEVDVGEATAVATTSFVEGSTSVIRIEKAEEGRARVTAGGERVDSPSVWKAGAVEIEPGEEIIDIGDRAPIISDSTDSSRRTSRPNDWPELDLVVSEGWASDTDGTNTIRGDLGEQTETPVTSTPRGAESGGEILVDKTWFDVEVDAVHFEVEASESMAHLEIAPPGEPIDPPPVDLPPPLREHLEESAADADDEDISIQYAIERPFDDVVGEYLSTSSTDHSDQFRELVPGETIELEMTIPRAARVDQAAEVDAAALSWTEIGQGIELVNDNFGSLPFGSTTFGRKSIEFGPTPAGEADDPIVVYTGADGRIVPDRTRRGEPTEGRPDYEVTMPRSDVHSILRSENPGEVASVVWDAGRVSIRPHGLMNQITYWIATAALAIARFLGL